MHIIIDTLLKSIQTEAEGKRQHPMQDTPITNINKKIFIMPGYSDIYYNIICMNDINLILLKKLCENLSDNSLSFNNIG